MPSDVVRLVVAGREFSGWTGATVNMAIDEIADSFSLSVPFDAKDPALVATFKPYKYQPAQLFIDTDLYITARIDSIASSLSESGRILTVQGRSLTSILIDSSVEDPKEYSGLTLSAIARQLCKPHGIALDVRADSLALELARPDYGDTVAKFLNSLAAPRHILLASSYAGALILASGKSLQSAPVSADLEEGRAPVLSIDTNFDGTRRFSTYKAATQFAGVPDIVGTVIDPAITLYRPYLATVSDTDQDPSVTAARLRSEANAGALSLSVKLSGWRRPDGKRWAERQAVTLVAPSALLPVKAKYIIAGVTLTLDASGQTTTLRLALPETYSGDNPKETPWA